MGKIKKLKQVSPSQSGLPGKLSRFQKALRLLWDKRHFRNMTLRQAMAVLTVLTLLISILVLAILMNGLEALYSAVMAPYLEEKMLTPQIGTTILVAEPQGVDAFLLDLIPNLQMLSVLFVIGGAIVVESFIFYRIKLKKPIALLQNASKKIAGNDLDFSISYSQLDEMGDLCRSFEIMRSSLYENNRKMWRAMEERKRLNAAFSHDLRTPLTVLRGYADLLEQYLPSNELPREKLILTVSTMSSHITRLENYVSSMTQIQKLEDIEPQPVPVLTKDFLSSLRDSGAILASETGKRFSFQSDVPSDALFLDPSLVSQVYENLLSNGTRYAKSALKVCCGWKDGLFSIEILDDGPGFSPEGLQNACKPFYTGDSRTDGHFGLGLNICKILCEKLGGSIQIQNGEGQGGKITASFKAAKNSTQ